jgi:integrase
MASVRKRTWATAAGEKKTAWVVDYVDQQKKPHMKTFPTRRAAIAWRAEVQVAVARGTHTPERKSVTVAETAQLWLEHVAAEGKEPATLRGYDILVRLHIVPTLGAAKLAHLSTPMLEAWRDDLVATRSRYRASKVLTVLKSILKEAKRRGLVAQNLAAEVEIRLDSRDAAPIEAGVHFPSKDDVRRLLTILGGAHWQAKRPLFVTAIFTGMRASELRALTWSAVNFAAETVTVRERADEKNIVGKPKSKAGNRAIPMSPTLLNTLREWKLRCPRTERGLVFPSEAGTIQFLSNIAARDWHPLQKEAGLVRENGQGRYGFHKLRHFAASLWIELGFSPKRLQTMLGHSTIKMTYDTYGHLFPSPEDDRARLARGEVGLVS